jgi:integrase
MAIRTKNTKSGPVYYVETRGTWERVGGDRREAQRLNERRKKEAKAGTFAPKVSGAVTIGRYLETWLAGKTNRSASQDRVHIETHVLPREWFSKMKVEDARPGDFQRLVNEIKAGPPKLAPKYIANIFGSVRAAFRAALRQEVVTRDVCLLEPGTISKKSKERTPYSLAEARALVASATGERLIWLAMALYTGMRCGEVCGRRWRDWDPESKPLGGLAIATQYDDQPLKGDDDSTDRPRRAPVHPDLAQLLGWWWREGFELVYLRKPTQDDFIVERHDAPGQNLTRSMTYKALERDCALAKVPRRGQHATRHTFLTQARRASPQAKELAEKITHNAAGEMVDNYTHWEWEPLCSVVSAYPSLLPNSETAPGLAPDNSNTRGKAGTMMNHYSASSPALSSDSTKLSIRVLELELKNKGVGETISEAVSESGDWLREANRLRKARLSALEAAEPGLTAPGLAACRALDAAYDGSVAGMESALADMASGLGGRS